MGHGKVEPLAELEKEEEGTLFLTCPRDNRLHPKKFLLGIQLFFWIGKQPHFAICQCFARTQVQRYAIAGDVYSNDIRNDIRNSWATLEIERSSIKNTTCTNR